MASGYDGSIRIDTRVDSRGFNQGIGGLMAALGKLAGAIGLAFGLGAVISFGKSAVDTASQISNAFIGMQSIIEGQGRSWSKAKSFIDDYISDGLVPVMNATTAYKNLAARGYSDEQISQVMNALKNSAAFGRQSSLTLGQAVQSATEGLKNENSILVDNAGVTKNVSVMWKEYAASIGTTALNLTKEQKIQAEVAGIMQETRFQMGDAAKMAGSYSGQVSALGVSWMNLKAGIGNAIIPVLTVIIPYVKIVIDWLVVLFNTFARVMALFFNVDTSMSAAGASAGGVADSTGAVADNTQQAADSAGDLAGNTAAAGKAAKGALAAFDQLNVLQMQDASGGGGGAAKPPAAGGGLGNINVGEPKDLIPDELLEEVEAFKKKLLDFFAPLKEPFERLRKAIISLGGTIWQGLQWAWENILVPLGTWLVQQAAPVFLDLLTAAINLLNSALQALAPLGQWLWDNFLQPIAAWTGEAILNALKWLTDRLNDLSKWISENPESFRTIITLLAGLAAVIFIVVNAVTIFGAVLGVVSAVLTGFSAVAAAVSSPLLLIVLGIIAIIAIVAIMVMNWIQNWEIIKQKASEAWAWIVQTWSVAAPWFNTNVITPVSNWFNTAWANIQLWADQAWKWIKDIWGQAFEWFSTTVIQPIQDGFDAVLKWISGGWESTFTGIVDFVREKINSVIDMMNGMVKSMVAGLNAMIGALNSIQISIPPWVPVYGNKKWSLEIPYIETPSIPKLATGAVVPAHSNMLAMIGEGSKREIVAPDETIRQIVREELEGASSANVSVSFDGTMGELIRVLKPHIQQENRRVGKSLIVGGQA